MSILGFKTHYMDIAHLEILYMNILGCKTRCIDLVRTESAYRA